MVFIVLKVYPDVMAAFGLTKIFWFHAAVMVVGIVFVYVFMPETRGLTLTQLNEVFGGKVFYEDDQMSDSGNDNDVEKGFNNEKGGLANSAVVKVTSTAALSKVASAAALSKVASIAASLSGRGKKGKTMFMMQ